MHVRAEPLVAARRGAGASPCGCTRRVAARDAIDAREHSLALASSPRSGTATAPGRRRCARPRRRARGSRRRRTRYADVGDLAAAGGVERRVGELDEDAAVRALERADGRRLLGRLIADEVASRTRRCGELARALARARPRLAAAAGARALALVRHQPLEAGRRRPPAPARRRARASARSGSRRCRGGGTRPRRDDARALARALDQLAQHAEPCSSVCPKCSSSEASQTRRSPRAARRAPGRRRPSAPARARRSGRGSRAGSRASGRAGSRGASRAAARSRAPRWTARRRRRRGSHRRGAWSASTRMCGRRGRLAVARPESSSPSSISGWNWSVSNTVGDALQDHRHPVEPHAGVDVARRQRRQRLGRVLVVLHEDEVPELEEARVLAAGKIVGAAVSRPRSR